MSKYLFLLWMLVWQTSVVKADWSVTKLLTIHHYGDPSDNDGFHPEAFLFEKEVNERSYYSIGIMENSEGYYGPLIGYSTKYRQFGRLSLTRHIYLSSNYRELPFIAPIPLLGVKYQLSKNVSIGLQGIPVPAEKPYILFISGINFNL